MKNAIRKTLLGIVAGTMVSTTGMAQYSAQNQKQNSSGNESLVKNLQKEVRAANRARKIKDGKGTQFYFGGGVEYDIDSPFASSNMWGQYSEPALIAQGALGIKFGMLGIGGTVGYSNTIEKDTEEYFTSIYTDPYGNQIEIGGTRIKKNIKYIIMQPGLEVTFFPIKNLGFGVGVQYNIVNTDTTGTVYQTITDGAGNVNGKLTTIKEKTGKQEFFTLNPSLELKLHHWAIDVGIKYSLREEYKSSISANAMIKIYLGK